MKIKLKNIRRTVCFTTVAASSASIQLLAQSFYPTFEERANSMTSVSLTPKQAVKDEFLYYVPNKKHKIQLFIK